MEPTGCRKGLSPCLQGGTMERYRLLTVAVYLVATILVFAAIVFAYTQAYLYPG